MALKYQKIRRTPTFITAYSSLRERLRKSSPLAYFALPTAMLTILDVIDRHPKSWPVKRKVFGGVEREFHLAITAIAYRRLHVRYYVDAEEVSHLLAVWVDGQDEPQYSMN